MLLETANFLFVFFFFGSFPPPRRSIQLEGRFPNREKCQLTPGGRDKPSLSTGNLASPQRPRRGAGFGEHGSCSPVPRAPRGPGRGRASSPPAQRDIASRETAANE